MKHLLHFKTLFAVMLMLFCVNGAWAQTTITKNIKDFPAGKQYAVNERHDLGDGLVIYTTECHFTSELRIYNGGYVISDALSGNIKSIKLNAGKNEEVLNIYGSNDKSVWTLIGTMSVVSSYKDCTLDFGTHEYKCFKIDPKGSKQIRIKTISVTYADSSDPSLQDQTLSFGETTSFEVEEGATFAAPTLTGAKTAVTYESEDPKVATVNATTGEVTIKGAGTTTITATAAADATYNAASASYTLTVIAAPKTVQNIADFLAKKADKSTVYTFANPVVVVKQHNDYLWVKDDSGYLQVYGNVGQTYNLGDEIPAGFSGVHSIYKEVHQVSSPAGLQTATQTGLEVLPIEMKVGAITTADINKYVVLKGVTFGNREFVAADKSSIAYYDKFNLENDFPKDANQYDVVAIVSHHNSLQVLPISWTMVENGKKDQTLSFPAAEYNATKGVAFESPKVTGNKTTVTYSSDNTKVATVDANTGDVTLVGEGDATITATAEVTTEYNGASASYVLHVAKGEVKGEALPYRQVGGSADLSENFTNEGLDNKDYKDAANLKFAKTGAKLTMKLAEAPATLSYFVHWNGSGTFGNFVVETSVDGKVYEELTAYTDVSFANGQEMGAYFTLNENVRYIRWTYVKKVSGNMGLGSIFVTKKGDVTAYPVKMSAVKHATFFANEAVVVPTGLTANYATVNGATIRLTPAYNAGDVLPANTPVVLTGEAADYELGKTIASTTKAKGANDLCGALTDDVINAQADEKFYILANDDAKGLGFYFQGKGTDGSSVHGLANKAYLVATGAAATVKGFALEGDATGIEGIETEMANEAIYTLSGVRVNADKNNLPKGLYIIGGKKVLVK